MVQSVFQVVLWRTAKLATIKVILVLSVIQTILASTEYATIVPMLTTVLFVMGITPVGPVLPATLLFQMESVLAAAILFALPAHPQITVLLVLLDTASIPATTLTQALPLPPASLAMLEDA
jgi:hypothetical protein